MQGNILGQSAGINIRGIIEQYKVAAGENVKAGDFVEFVNNEKDSFMGNFATYQIVATDLDESKVILIYRNSHHVYGVVCDINGTEINLRNSG